MRWLRALPIVLAAAALLIPFRTQAAVDGNVIVSLDSIQNQMSGASGGYSYPPFMSDDGNFVAFQTLGLTNPGDRNGVQDIVRRDVSKSATITVSVASDGQQANGASSAPVASADGTLIVFESLASNLVLGDANNVSDIYLRDLSAQTTTRISVPAGGADSDGASYRPAISGNGAYVAFCSRASNLVAGDDSGTADMFLFDRAAGTSTWIPTPGTASGSTNGCQNVAIDNDGAVVAFTSTAGGKSNVYVFNRTSGAVTPIAADGDDSSGVSGLAISGDGRLVAFDSLAANLIAGDSNRARDVFVRDLSANTTTRVSVRSDGGQLPGDSGASRIAISRDGRFVVFGSTAREVVQGDSNGREDVFRHEMASGQTTIVSVNAQGLSANNSSYAPAISADGSVVAFASLAADIYPRDGNRQPDVFVRGGTFPGQLGSQIAPLDTGALRDDSTLPPTLTSSSEIPLAAIIGGAAAAAVILLAGSWLLLGRRGRA